MSTSTKDICCPKFNPEPWDNKEFVWDNKQFIKDKVSTFFYMPLNYGAVMTRLQNAAEKNKATVPDWLNLSDHTSKWKMDLYLAVDREIPGVQNVTLSGKFIAKVYEGDFKDTGKWTADFEAYAHQKSLKIKKCYMWYTTCPKCAKKYGKNYVVLIAEV